MEKLKEMLPYLLINLGIFYLLPTLMKDTGSAMIILLILMPLGCFLTSLAYGEKSSFSWPYPIFVMLIFLPSIFIFYNESAMVYVFVYGFISLLGSFVGDRVFRKI